MPIEVVERYTREEIKANPDKWYVFGDNNQREGTGGQAFACRGEWNTVGIRTKKAPTYNPEDFLTDDEYKQNVENIVQDTYVLAIALMRGKTIVLPKDGVGTGRANLKEKAPRTLEYIQRCFKMLHQIDATIGVINEDYTLSQSSQKECIVGDQLNLAIEPHKKA